jgi:hypothetical protein
VLNWQEVSADLRHWIQREALGDGLGSEAATLLAELLALPGVAYAEPTANLDARALPFLPMQLRKDGTELNLFTTIATLGTPHDVTVHKLRVESFFPTDDATARWFQERCARTPGACAARRQGMSCSLVACPIQAITRGLATMAGHCVLVSQQLADGSAVDALAALPSHKGLGDCPLPVVVLLDVQASPDIAGLLRAGALELLDTEALTPQRVVRAIDAASWRLSRHTPV